MAGANYYETLCVKVDASCQEIRNSFKKLATKYHPDKNPKEGEQFKKISQAYQVLLDPSRRANYDKFGYDCNHSAENDSINSLYSGKAYDFEHGVRSLVPRKSEPLLHTILLNLETLYSGRRILLALRKNMICHLCQGKGTKTDAKKDCSSCQGRAFQVVTCRIYNGVFQQMKIYCSECHSTGQVPKDLCQKCNGEKVTQQRKYLSVTIEKGMVQGQHIVIYGEGDQQPGVEPGDVIVILNQNVHANFKRKGDDLLYHMKITLTEALCGFDKVVTHLNGRGLHFKHPCGKVIQPNMIKRVIREGMPIYKRPGTYGDLFIMFDVVFPDDFSGINDVKTLESLLPQRPLPSKQRQHALDECSMISSNLNLFGVSIKSQKIAQAEAGADAFFPNEEEDEESGTQCAHQ